MSQSLSSAAVMIGALSVNVYFGGTKELSHKAGSFAYHNINGSSVAQW